MEMLCVLNRYSRGGEVLWPLRSAPCISKCKSCESSLVFEMQVRLYCSKGVMQNYNTGFASPGCTYIIIGELRLSYAVYSDYVSP